jgi:hypothetical protein
MKRLVFSSIVALLAGCGQDSSVHFTAQPTCTTRLVEGGSLVSCPDGTETLIANGETGPQGPAGLPGAAGTVITPVQLCPNVSPTYASVFPEYAICLDGVLYGTYNGNTAYQYLAALPNGAYSSDGQGAACSFTITGCVISY